MVMTSSAWPQKSLPSAMGLLMKSATYRGMAMASGVQPPGRSTSSPRPSVRSSLVATGVQGEPALDAAGAPAPGPPGGVRRLLEKADPQVTGLTAITEADLGALVGAGTLHIALLRDEPHQLAQEEPHVQQADAALCPSGWAPLALLTPDPHLDQPTPAGLVPPQVEEYVHVG